MWRGAGIATLLCALACGVPLSGCGGSSDSGGTTASTSTGASGEPTATPVDVHALPVGTDRYVTDGPKKGYVYSCITDFNGGGADVMGPWFSSDGKTFDLTKKVAVEGKVRWDSKFSEEVSGSKRALSGNGLPPDPSGVFPVHADDPAYQYDRNPNSISGYTLAASLPANPEGASEPSCVGGTIGVAKTGIPIFSAFDAGGRDAVAWETQDRCDAHPEMTGQYHYHSLSACIAALSDIGGEPSSSELIGWALDGFGIYVERDSEGTMLSSADLDACHGRTSAVDWNGKRVSMYHYDATLDFPYLVACYHGTAIDSAEGLAIRRPDTGGPPPGGAP